MEKAREEDDLQEEEEEAWEGWIDGWTAAESPTEPLC